MPSRPRVRSRLPLLLMLALVAPSVAGAQIEEPRIPLQTALSEINRLRAEYTDAFNRKDAMALAAFYAPDAIVITQNGSTLVGQDAIRRFLVDQAPNFPQQTLTSDSLRVYGNTAVDVGRLITTREGGGQNVSQFLTVLRRGMNEWKVVRVAVVPVSGGM